MSIVIFQNQNTKEEFSFENKVYLIEDKKLVNGIKKQNYKNADSPFVFKSLDNLHVSDVVQIKINLKNTGTFLASFKKDELVEEKRQKLLEEIGGLKSDEEPTNETQTKKIVKLMKILGKYAPIYVAFGNLDTIKVELNDSVIKGLSFPLLVLPEQKKIFLNLKFKKTNSTSETQYKENEKPSYSPIELFVMDYFFIFLFSALGALAIVTAVFEIMNKQGIGVFLIILAVAFVVTEAIAMTLTIYSKGKEKNPYLRFYLASYIVVGVVIGIVGGYFISKGLLKTEIENFNYGKVVLISSLASSITLLSSIGTSIPLNKLIIKINNRKEKH